ncbi:hypothetical protein AN403_6064 [Pseudomonas fluorescens]|uniref:Uncharacterized protein n=1 Tax=Pseudomonas fluorescens TaxID=294 RepID=A0A0P8XN40_PSEFL|nr:hypothetical protein AN403_6064 [Pseudomonas fluorescens]
MPKVFGDGLLVCVPVLLLEADRFYNALLWFEHAHASYSCSFGCNTGFVIESPGS